LTHIIGRFECSEVLRDPVFNVAVNNAIKMQRKVEVFKEDVLIKDTGSDKKEWSVVRRWDTSANSTMPEITW